MKSISQLLLQTLKMGLSVISRRRCPRARNFLLLSFHRASMSSLLMPVINSSSITRKPYFAEEGLGFIMCRGFEHRNITTSCSQFPSKAYRSEDGGEKDFVKATRNVMMGFNKMVPMTFQRHYCCSPADCKDITSVSRRLTAEDIAGRGWHMLDESENDWRSHAAVVAQSIQLIKKRMQVICLLCFHFYSGRSIFMVYKAVNCQPKINRRF